MYVHVPGRIDRRRISKLASRSRDQLFLRAAGNLCKVYVRAWLDRGADTSRGTPCESLTSAFRWAEEAQGDEELLSMLRGGSVTLVVGRRGGSVREAALFLFVSSESICDSALECVRLGWGRGVFFFFRLLVA